MQIIEGTLIILVAGIPPSKLVEAHGTFTTASCTQCGKKYNGETIKVSNENFFKFLETTE